MPVHFSCSIGGQIVTADADRFVDLCVPVRPYADGAEQPRSFYLPAASAAPFTVGSFVAAVSSGASINCPVVSSLCVHANGTHTECVGHALPGRITLEDVFGGPGPADAVLTPALLLTVVPRSLGEDEEGDYTPGSPGDRIVRASDLDAAAEGVAVAAADAGWGCDLVRLLLEGGGALIIRSRPGTTLAAAQSLDQSGANPPYLAPSAMRWALARGARHLLTDLPSADKEEDGGALLAHRAWWGLPPRDSVMDASIAATRPLCSRTITELCFVPGPPVLEAPAAGYAATVEVGATRTPVADGPYLLSLQVAPIALDAAPSRPLLFPLRWV
jgi:arylformamidase